MRLTIFQMQVRTTVTPRMTKKRKERSCDSEKGNEEEEESTSGEYFYDVCTVGGRREGARPRRRHSK